MAQNQTLDTRIAAAVAAALAGNAVAPAAPTAPAAPSKGEGAFTPTLTLDGKGRFVVTFEAWPKGQRASSTGKSWLLGGGAAKLALPDGTQVRLTLSLSTNK